MNFWNHNRTKAFGKTRKQTSFLVSPHIIKHKPKKLSPYGDEDLDGTPNKYDCNPWRADRDAKPLRPITKSIKKIVSKSSFKNLRTSRKATMQRAAVGRGIAGLIGAEAKKRTGRPGRPAGTYKYGMPIHLYKKQQALQKQKYREFQAQEERRLAGRGLTTEQVRQLQAQRTMEQPTEQAEQVEMQPQMEEEMPEIQAMPVQSQNMPARIKHTAEKQAQMMEVTSKADDDLAFRKWMALKTISPRTQEILLRLRRTQLKGPRDDVEMQRRLEERRMVADAGNLLKTPFIFKTHQLDITGVSEDNILMAPNTFKENPENFILKRRERNILDTRENTLRF